MKKLVLTLLNLLIILTLFSQEEKRIALLIGNSAYPRDSSNKYSAKAAKDLGAELKLLGFDTQIYTDLTANQIKVHMREFGDKLISDKGVGLFFYSGRGIQNNGENYLIPVDAIIEKEQDLELEGVNLKRIMGEMESAQNKKNIIIYDANRNNPLSHSFSASSGNGSASFEIPLGTFIAYATAPGSKISNRNGENGLYVQELIKALQIPDLKLDDVFKRVRREVYQLSNKQQIPWEHSNFEDDFDFYFNKK